MASEAGREHISRIDVGQPAALAAVVEFGSFDAAAARLHVTPSAVSQRIKALEREVKELRRANEILRTASAFFAQAELDRQLKK